MAKRSNGEGSLYATSDGRWRGAVVVAGRRRYVTGKTKGDASRKLRALVRSAEDGVPVADARPTVETFLTSWLADVVPARSTVKAPTTVEGYRWAVEGHLIPALGPVKLRDLRPEHVEKMLSDKAAGDETHAPMSASSVARLRRVLSTALKWACRRELVPRNVAELAELPAVVKPARERKAMTEAQVRTLLEHVRGDRLEALYVVALTTALRPAELRGLCWSDVDLEAGVLHVRRALKREADDAVYLGDTKTTRSRRAIRLPAATVDALRSHKARQAAERLVCGPAWSDGEAVDLGGYVFTVPTGQPLDRSRANRSFKATCKAAGIGADWTLYETRHTALTMLSAEGVPLELLADLAGHVDTRQLMETYRHTGGRVVEAAAAPMERLTRRTS